MSAASDPDVHFRDWPAGADPAAVGRRVAEAFIAENPSDPKHYKVACAWYGSLSVSALLNEKAMLASLVTRYDSYENGWSTYRVSNATKYLDLAASTSQNLDENAYF